MSIADEMKKLADSKQPELTLNEKHELIAKIKEQAEQGNYDMYLYDYLNKWRSVLVYLQEIGFMVDVMHASHENKIEVYSIYVRWGE